MQSVFAAHNPYREEDPMYRTVIGIATIVVAATVVGSTGHVANVAVASPTPVMAEAFWRCPSGFAFETSGSAVHCKKPAWTETKAFMPCMIPTPDLKTDLVNTTDMCSGGIGVAVTAEPLCYPTDIANGFTKRRVAGRDYCGKPHPAEVIAPNQMISL
jgi:hypothetical protein